MSELNLWNRELRQDSAHSMFAQDSACMSVDFNKNSVMSDYPVQMAPSDTLPYNKPHPRYASMRRTE